MSTDEEWTERFIEVIESKPPIYNKSMKAHFDKKLIKQLWNEVYVEMVENWDDLPTSAKATKGRIRKLERLPAYVLFFGYIVVY